MAQFSYRFAFVAAAATYGIVVYKSHFARGRFGGSIPAMAIKLAGDENVQYLGKYLIFPANYHATCYNYLLFL